MVVSWTVPDEKSCNESEKTERCKYMHINDMMVHNMMLTNTHRHSLTHLTMHL